MAAKKMVDETLKEPVDTGLVAGETEDKTMETVSEGKNHVDDLVSAVAQLTGEEIGKLKELLGLAGPSVQTETPVGVSPDYWQQPVKIKLFKDNDKYKDDVFVGVAGKTYLIKRGIEVEVPRCVAQVIDDSHNQEMFAISYCEGLEKDYEAQTKEVMGE